MPYVGVFIFAFLEAVAVVGLVVPGTTAVAAAGAAAQSGRLNYWVVVVAATMGAFAGDATSFVGGRLLHRWKFMHPWFERHALAVERAERFVGRWGAFAVILGRFFAPTRAFVPLIAGTGRMPISKFMIANAAGAAAWSLVAVELGEGAMQLYEHVPSRWTLVIVAVVLGAWLVWALFRWMGSGRGGSESPRP